MLSVSTSNLGKEERRVIEYLFYSDKYYFLNNGEFIVGDPIYLTWATDRYCGSNSWGGSFESVSFSLSSNKGHCGL